MFLSLRWIDVNLAFQASQSRDMTQKRSSLTMYIDIKHLYFILYSETQCISKLDKIGIFIHMKFH